MKEKRQFNLPSNKLINKARFNVAELLEFHLIHLNEAQRFLVNIAKVQKVLPFSETAIRTQSDAYGSATIMLNDKSIPIFDLGRFINKKVSDENSRVRKDVIVLSFSGQTYGVLVDRIVRIHYLNWQELKESRSNKEDYLIALTQIDGIPYGMLDLERIVADLFQLEHAESEKNLPQISSKRMALIDDSSLVRNSISQILAAKDVFLKTYSSGVLFIEQQKKSKHSFDTIIIDVEMPGMNGIALTGILRKDPFYQNTQIIVFSSIDDQNLKEQAIAQGADGYAVKSNLEELFSFMHSQAS